MTTSLTSWVSLRTEAVRKEVCTLQQEPTFLSLWDPSIMTSLTKIKMTTRVKMVKIKMRKVMKTLEAISHLL